ncbi:hypothetical protein FB45DRAFT_863222 [Roridomyces roridus]|uniref:Uncharacterized protein n=1 Tax=Roridomyces roridus TaxID=1738132 RepID=A0AAD7FXC8_9AGAR|nr:hypothetical protein FB45DRAFT_863222 [Roridomyces roridus]
MWVVARLIIGSDVKFTFGAKYYCSVAGHRHLPYTSFGKHGFLGCFMMYYPTGPRPHSTAKSPPPLPSPSVPVVVQHEDSGARSVGQLQNSLGTVYEVVEVPPGCSISGSVFGNILRLRVGNHGATDLNGVIRTDFCSGVGIPKPESLACTPQIQLNCSFGHRSNRSKVMSIGMGDMAQFLTSLSDCDAFHDGDRLISRAGPHGNLTASSSWAFMHKCHSNESRTPSESGKAAEGGPEILMVSLPFEAGGKTYSLAHVVGIVQAYIDPQNDQWTRFASQTSHFVKFFNAIVLINRVLSRSAMSVGTDSTRSSPTRDLWGVEGVEDEEVGAELEKKGMSV